ncbi:MAG: hypothetical protein GY854_31665 [Deltaproteobacteria bacterium]|nr:hypothetical protein [Deltaproteobacteria bacterium]
MRLVFPRSKLGMRFMVLVTCMALCSNVLSGSNEHIVIGQLNLWYFGDGPYGGFEDYDGNGQRSVSLTPYLGNTYYSSDADVIHQQIEWAAEYGVDAFSLEWTTPLGIPGSLEENIDDHFLQAPNLYKIRWCIFYDFVLRLMQTPGLDVDLSQGMDFDDPDVYDTFVSDFEHFAVKYFDHPYYLKAGDRPVLYIWATWNFKGDNLAQAVEDARQIALDNGFDVYIVGDEIRANAFDGWHAALFDANTTFTFLIPGASNNYANVAEAAASMSSVYSSWKTSISGLNVTGGNEPVNFQPSFTPQYDDRLFKEVNNFENPQYVPAESKAQVVTIAEVARDHAVTLPGEDEKFVWLNTFNNWAETTTVEPTAADGPKYPAGNYQFDMLEVVEEVFGYETFYLSHEHCGQADEACTEDEVCCPGDGYIFPDRCADTSADYQYCGSCALNCSSTFFPTTACCDSLCIDTLRDVNNCGECGRVCSEDQVCAMGACLTMLKPIFIQLKPIFEIIQNITAASDNSYDIPEMDDGKDAFWKLINDQSTAVDVAIELCPTSGDAILGVFQMNGAPIVWANDHSAGGCETIDIQVPADTSYVVVADTAGGDAEYLGECNLTVSSGKTALLVANGYYSQETILRDHLLARGFEVDIVKDYQLNGSTELSGYDLIVLTGFAPNVYGSGMVNITSSGVPIFVIEYWDYIYSEKLGLVDDPWSGTMYATTVELSSYSHQITAPFDGTETVYTNNGVILGAPMYAVEPGVLPLVYSSSVYGQAAMLVDDTRGIAVTGIHALNRYTDTGWELLDSAIDYLVTTTL